MSPEIAEQAALNNAVWCNTVCATHGCPGAFKEAAWVNPQQVPPFYPNAVTLAGRAQAEAHREGIRELLQGRVPPLISIKDSFQTLDLDPLGFRILFEAQWIYRPAALPEPRVRLPEVRWQTVADASDLAAWGMAWSVENGSSGIFRSELLREESIVIIAARREGRIVAGAVANRAAGVVRVSNVFVPAGEAPQFRSACIAQVMKVFPDLTLVDYASGAELAELQDLGFQAVGPLRVWVQQSATASP